VGAVRFEVVGEIADVETIAVGRSIRDLVRLRKAYGSGRWRKMKESLRSDCPAVVFGVRKSTGTRLMGSVARNSSASDT
jgi:hypothetical protein